MANYIYPAPGVTNSEVTVLLENKADTTNDALVITGFQDVTINAANDTFSWEQLDETAKKQIATTSTNSITMNLVVNKATFFGTDPADAGGTSTMAVQGIMGASRNKTLVEFDIFTGKESDGSAGVYIYGEGYITGLAPTVSAGEPVWVTPVTISVTGEYTVGTSATLSDAAS